MDDFTFDGHVAMVISNSSKVSSFNAEKNETPHTHSPASFTSQMRKHLSTARCTAVLLATVVAVDILLGYSFSLLSTTHCSYYQCPLRVHKPRGDRIGPERVEDIQLATSTTLGMRSTAVCSFSLQVTRLWADTVSWDIWTIRHWKLRPTHCLLQLHLLHLLLLLLNLSLLLKVKSLI